jgi:hypothetical protein
LLIPSIQEHPNLGKAGEVLAHHRFGPGVETPYRVRRRLRLTKRKERPSPHRGERPLLWKRTLGLRPICLLDHTKGALAIAPTDVQPCRGAQVPPLPTYRKRRASNLRRSLQVLDRQIIIAAISLDFGKHPVNIFESCRPAILLPRIFHSSRANAVSFAQKASGNHDLGQDKGHAQDLAETPITLELS